MSSGPETGAKSPRLFRCPSCGAALEVVDAPSVTCKYCGSHVPVPADLRPQKPQIPHIVIQTPGVDYSQQVGRVTRTGQRAGCIIAVVVLLLIGGITIFALSTVQTAVNSATSGLDSAFDALSTAVPAATPAPSFAEVVLQFGGEGTGPGLFEDSRYIAVDGDGNIYVAEYDSGRLQKFDPDGRFVQQFTLEEDRNGNIYVSGMAVDYEGHLYVSRSGDILKYTTDGELVAAFSGDGDTRYGSIAVDANNILYALNDAERGLVKLDNEGNELLRVTDLIFSVDEDEFSFNVNIAVDGTGQIFVTSGFGNKVYLYDSNGKYLDRFGEEGTGAGHLSSPGAVAVDGRGRVYVSTFGGIAVFNNSGIYLGNLPRDFSTGAVFGVTIDLDGNIYSITNQGVVHKYRLASRG